MTSRPPRLCVTMRGLALGMLVSFLILPALGAWALGPGDQVVAQCKANPFDKSQMSKANIYAEASIYSQVVTETCGEKLTVLEAANGWVKVHDRKNQYAGYLNEKDIAKIIPSPKGAAKTSRAVEAAKPPRPISG